MKHKRNLSLGIAAAVIAVALLSAVDGVRHRQTRGSESAATGNVRESDAQAASVSPLDSKTVRGTRAYVVRTSLAVQKLHRAVDESGARIVSRLAHGGAVVEATDDAVSRLRKHRGVKSVKVRGGEAKLSRALSKKLRQSASEESLQVMISLINSADAALVGERIVTAGGRVMSQPRADSQFVWLGAEVPRNLVTELAGLAEVSWIEPQGKLTFSNHEAVQPSGLDVIRAWDDVSGLGLSGAGQVIGHADTGLDLGDITKLEREFAGHVKAIYDHTKVGGVRDTNGHGTHTAGSIVGQGLPSTGKYRGVAHGATLVHQTLGSDGKIPTMPDDINALFAEAYQDGARLHSDSWGNDNKEYDALAQTLDEFVWSHPDFLPLVASGNNGDEPDAPEVSSPALARNSLAVGAARRDGTVVDFSAHGIDNERDERIKPEVLAPGVGIVSVQSLAIRNPKTCEDEEAGTRYFANDGTSMATPLATGAMALMREWYMREKESSPSAAMLTAMAIGGAIARSEANGVSDVSGWGLLGVASTIAPTNGVAIRLRDVHVESCESAEFSEVFLVTNSSERLVFSLAWLDMPADPSDEESGLLVDYDLAVFAPDGTRHWPNGGTEEDHVNTRETVVVTNAMPGLWTVTVDPAEQSETGGALGFYARGAFAADASAAQTNVWALEDGDSIQDAVDWAKSGDTITLEAGMYAPFVVSNKMLTIRGAGRDRTVIRSDYTLRGVELSLPGHDQGVVLDGVTIEYGSADYGGGIRGGTLRNSTIRNCVAQYGGGGAYEAELDHCIVSNCTVAANAAPEDDDDPDEDDDDDDDEAGDDDDEFIFLGGGAGESILHNCLIADCSVYQSSAVTDAKGEVIPMAGGGAANSKLSNVTVVNSRLLSSDEDSKPYGGVAIYDCVVQNTLVSGATYNYQPVKACYFGETQSGYLAVVGEDAFVDFAAGDYRLSPNAVAAIDAGCTNYVSTYPSASDLAGERRVYGNSVDLGCYESTYTNSLPPSVAGTWLTGNSGSVISLAVGVADVKNPELGITMVNDAWEMAAHEQGLAGADATCGELLSMTVSPEDFQEAADRIVDRVQPNDIVILSVSTHGAESIDDDGVRVASNDTFFVLSDEQALYPSNVVDFARSLEAKGAKLVQVYDTCFSGAFAELTDYPAVTAVTRQEMSAGMTVNGSFTTAFLEAWRNPPASADMNGDGFLSLYELAVETQRNYRGVPAAMLCAECCIYQPEELAKIAVREMPDAADPLRILTDRTPPAYVNRSYGYQLYADCDSGAEWTALSPLPDGLTLEPGGLVRGYPAWSTVSNFQVRVRVRDGRTAEANVVFGGLLAATNSRPRLKSVSVPQGLVVRRIEDDDWEVAVEAESVQDPTSAFQYVFTVVARGDDQKICCVTNDEGTLTVDADDLADWPEVYVTCKVLGDEDGQTLSEGNVVWFIRTDVPFPASRVGVCSWSWATNMTTILDEMDRMGVGQMQLSLVPWVKPLYGIEYPASLRETFGKGEDGDVFVTISNRISRGEISVLSTMISFPFDCWTDFAAISNSNGIVCNIDTNDTTGTRVSESDPLGVAAWTVNSNLIDQAAVMTRQLGVEYITTEVGYLDKVMMDHGTNANENCNIGLERLHAAHLLCARQGVKMLFESGQYSGERTLELIDIYTNRYASAPFANDYGLTVNDIGINYDLANHLIYGNDDPTNAFAVMRGRIAQVHVKDTYEDLATRTEICGFAGDVKWGTADVSETYDALAFLMDAGYEGNLLIEHEWGENRIEDIDAAIQAILLTNNGDDGSPWIAPQAMSGGTMGERCAASLRAHGFSPSVAAALASTDLYDDFTGWAVDNDLEPSDLVSRPGVILAAALGAGAGNLPETGEDVRLEIGNIETDGDDMQFDVFYGLSGYNPNLADIDTGLLTAALDCECATELDPDAFSSEGFRYSYGPASAALTNSVSISVDLGETNPGGLPFFIRVVVE